MKLVLFFIEVYLVELCDRFNVRDKGEWIIKENFKVLSLVIEKLLILLRDKENEGEVRSLLLVKEN